MPLSVWRRVGQFSLIESEQNLKSMALINMAISPCPSQSSSAMQSSSRNELPPVQGTAADADLRRKAIRGLASGVPIRIASQFLTFATLTVSARLLAPVDFGTYGIALVIGTLFQTLAESVLSNGLVQRPVADANHFATARYLSCCATLISLALCVALSPLMGFVFKDPSVGSVLMLMSLALPFKFMSAIKLAALQRKLKFQHVQIATCMGTLASLIMTVASAMLGCGVYSLAIGFVFNAIGEYGFARYADRSYVPATFDRLAAKELLAFSAPYTVSQLMNFVALQGPSFILGKLSGPVALGLFNRSYTLLTVPVNLVGGVGSKIIFATIARLQYDREKLSRFMLLSISASTRTLIPLGIGLAVSSPLIIRVALGSKWSGAQGVLSVLMLVLFARVGYLVPESMLVAIGRVRSSARRQMIYALATVIACTTGTLIGGLFGGAIGVAMGILIFYCSSMVALNDVVQRNLTFYMAEHLAGVLIAGLPFLAWLLLGNLLGELSGVLGYWVVLALLFVSAPRSWIGPLADLRAWLWTRRRPRKSEAFQHGAVVDSSLDAPATN